MSVLAAITRASLSNKPREPGGAPQCFGRFFFFFFSFSPLAESQTCLTQTSSCRIHLSRTLSHQSLHGVFRSYMEILFQSRFWQTSMQRICILNDRIFHLGTCRGDYGNSFNWLLCLSWRRCCVRPLRLFQPYFLRFGFPFSSGQISD